MTLFVFSQCNAVNVRERDDNKEIDTTKISRLRLKLCIRHFTSFFMECIQEAISTLHLMLTPKGVAFTRFIEFYFLDLM